MESNSSIKKISAWAKVSRLQFYPLTFIAYTLGTIAAYRNLKMFNLGVFLLGYLIIFLIELATVLTNEYYDYQTDKVNLNAGFFTGGSRVLVEEKLSSKEMKYGLSAVFILILISTFVFFQIFSGSSLSVLLLVAIGLFLGIGYTAPPIKFCYNGLGELVVAITHSPYVILCGYFFQGGSFYDPTPWIFSVPLFLAVFAANTLAGVPDYEADETVSKKSLAVIFGIPNASLIAISFIILAAATNPLLKDFKTLNLVLRTLILMSIFHGTILAVKIRKFILREEYYDKIDKIMLLALTYVIWYGIIPIVYFLLG